MLERITARRAELDTLVEELAKRLEEVQAEREELLVAERVLRRLEEHAAAEAEASTVPAKAQVAGRAVLLVPHRRDIASATALPGDYQKILAVVGRSGGPVKTKDVGLELGLDVAVRGRLEPLRGKLTKLADRGWLHKLPDGRFTARL